MLCLCLIQIYLPQYFLFIISWICKLRTHRYCIWSWIFTWLIHWGKNRNADNTVVFWQMRSCIKCFIIMVPGFLFPYLIWSLCLVSRWDRVAVLKDWGEQGRDGLKKTSGGEPWFKKWVLTLDDKSTNIEVTWHMHFWCLKMFRILRNHKNQEAKGNRTPHFQIPAINKSQTMKHSLCSRYPGIFFQTHYFTASLD